MTTTHSTTEIPQGRSEATTRLFAERAAATTDRRAAIEDELIFLNMSLACSVACRYRRRGIAEDDLTQVAYIGLIKAVKAFDPDKGYPFFGYAVPTIRGEIQRHFRDLGWTVRPPRSVQETQQKIAGCEAELSQQLRRAPRPSEIAAHLDIDVEQVIDALGATGCFAPASLDATGIDEDSEPVGHRLGDLDPGFDLAEARATLAPLLARLSRREQLIVEMRFFRSCTQTEIADEIGISQMHVSRLLSRLIARLREEVAAAAA